MMQGKGGREGGKKEGKKKLIWGVSSEREPMMCALIIQRSCAINS